jgi:hypothetical protein
MSKKVLLTAVTIAVVFAAAVAYPEIANRRIAIRGLAEYTAYHIAFAIQYKKAIHQFVENDNVGELRQIAIQQLAAGDGAYKMFREDIPYVPKHLWRVSRCVDELYSMHQVAFTAVLQGIEKNKGNFGQQIDAWRSKLDECSDVAGAIPREVWLTWPSTRLSTIQDRAETRATNPQGQRLEETRQLPTFDEMLPKAKAGDPVAQLFIGTYYYAAPNFAEALNWFGKAAENGYAPAQVAVAGMLEKGQGVGPDRVAAYGWYLIYRANCEDRGEQSCVENADKHLQRVEPYIAPDTRAEVRAKVAQYRGKAVK